MTEAATLEPGARMEDGSVYAGLTADGKQQIFAMPKDLKTMLGFHTMSFNKAVVRVAQLNADNALGHHDWQIPELQTLEVLEKNQNEGALKGTFKIAPCSGYVCRGWYWASTEDRYCPDSVHFSHDRAEWGLDDDRLSCRPVRLVPVGTL